jgi:hypothetical protein
MDDETVSTSQTLRDLAQVMRGGQEGNYEVKVTPEFLEFVANELDGVNSLKICSSNGDLVCTIDEPLASSIMNIAVKHYVERALREALESPNS